MKTAYIISPGVQLPGESFQWRNVPEIISQPMLWEAMRGIASGIVFRIRTEKNVGDKIDAADRIESAIGVIDSTTRWRACLAIIRTALAGLRIPEVAEPCWNVFGMLATKNPAVVTMSERQQLATQLRLAIDKLPGDDPRAAFESSVAAMCMRLAFVDNDVECAHVVPYGPIYMVNAGDHGEDREGTVEVTASSTFACEAYNRLMEKVPEWGFLALPLCPGVPTTQGKAVKAQEEPAETEED